MVRGLRPLLGSNVNALTGHEASGLPMIGALRETDRDGASLSLTTKESP